MPRALSLKKQVGPSKNQKTITAFLKCLSGTSNVLETSVETIENAKSSSTKNAKRKVLSPVKLHGTSLEKTTTEHNSDNCNRASKRVKTESPNKNKSPRKILTSKKKSPNKENSHKDVWCVKKNVDSYLEVPEGSQNEISVTSSDNHDFCDVNSNHGLSSEIIKSHLMIDFNEKTNDHVDIITLGNISPSKRGASSSQSPLKRNRTPKKSLLPIQEFKCSPDNELRKFDQTAKDLTSPSKCGSTVKILDFNTEEIGDVFGEDWGDDGMAQDTTEYFDLNTIQRCKILKVNHLSNRIELRLQNENKTASCFVEGIWLDTPLIPGDIISVLAPQNLAGENCVNNSSGLLVLRPDHLISSTSVVSGVFCKRKAVLQERWRGIDSANMAMTTGILIHELVQKALTQNITSMEELRIVSENIIKESVERLYDAGLTDEEARMNMQNYIPSLADFMNTYVASKPPTVAHVQKDKNNWTGHIDKVLDIEENLCCPELGLKGKIDATLQVTIHERKGRQRAVVPLELKSGKASMSAEHRGQLVLYGMMLNLQNSEDPTQAAQRGLLLYLRDRVEFREVSCGYPERRDLIMLRNQLVQYLSGAPESIDQEKLTDIEDASILLQQRLPEPVDHHNACAKCPYLTLCSLHLWYTDGPSVSDIHPLTKLRTEALGHLTQEHIKYFLHWTALLKIEELGQMVTSPLHALWTDNVQKREKRGTCAGNLKLKTVVSSGDRILHVFQRTCTNTEFNVDTKITKGPQEGEFSIVSIENRPWIAAGFVTVSNSKEIHILLERDLSRRLKADTRYHIDTYESYATTVQNLTNLGVLMEDSDRAERLRRLIIEKELPQFEVKLPREVGRLGTKLMRSLNIQQQRAVLKALSAKDYALLQGLPGTGKTQTISVLIQMLVGLKLRVLVTAHTHSAVDTVLCRIPETVRVMRLGSASRVAAPLLKRTEQTLTGDCNTPDQLAQIYNSMDVVGVTCLGAGHAMLARTMFDVCIVDEATQVLQCTVLRPLFAAKKFVLVGDPEQLPPVVRSPAARRLGMEESLFHKLMCEEVTSTLQLQYRMNQPVVDVANHVAYNGKLKCANQSIAEARLDIDMAKIFHLTPDSTWLKKACSPETENAVLFIDIDMDEDVIDVSKDKRNFTTNPTEACIVLALVETLKQGNVKSSDIGIIAPYRDQVSLLRRSMSQFAVEVSTVDQFQGRDKPVILFSCTKRAIHLETHKVKEGEVLNDQRRLAVSVTRAKHKLLIIGNSAALKRYEPLQKLINTCNRVKLDNCAVSNIIHKYKGLVGT